MSQLTLALCFTIDNHTIMTSAAALQRENPDAVVGFFMDELGLPRPVYLQSYYGQLMRQQVLGIKSQLPTPDTSGTFALPQQTATHEEGKTVKPRFIEMTLAEIQSGSSRVVWAEGLISQLHPEHEGRNSWLLNYGVREEAVALREKRNLPFVERFQAAATSNYPESM